MNEQQRKSFDRSIQRAVARSGNDEDEKLSLFIRVAESAIYNGKPVYKALLKEVIFLRLHDLHEGDLRIPKGTPWSKDYTKYNGWCYARQEYLAGRVGCEYKYANQALLQIVEDRYLKSRKYKGKDGAWHRQYFPDESFIDAKIAELEASGATSTMSLPRKKSPRKKSADKSVATPLSSLTRVASLDNHDNPVVMNTSSQSSLTRVANRDNHDVGSSPGLSLEVGGEVRLLRQPPSASPSGIVNAASLPNQEKANPNPVGALSSQAKTKAKPKATPERCGNPDCLEPLVPGEEHVCWEEGSVKVKAEIAGFEVEAE